MAVAEKIAFKPFEFDFEQTYVAADWGAGIAWRVYDYESEPDEDTEWTGYYIPTGRVLAHMVGDDCEFSFEPDELTPVTDYCPCCGQIPSCYGEETP
jgi:hypothetical protein